MKHRSKVVLVGTVSILLAACGLGTSGDSQTAPSAPAAPAAPEQAVEEDVEYDFSGMTITFVSPFPPGGTADITARLAAENFGKFANGNPRVVVENLAGGGGALAMGAVLEGNFDGNVRIVVPTVGVALRWILGAEGHTYPYESANMVGSLPGSLAMLVPLEVNSLADLVGATTEWTVGDNAPNNAPGLSNALVARMMNMPIRHVFGFEGEGPLAVSVERGEVQIVSVGDSAYRQTYKPLGVVKALLDHGYLSADGTIVPSELLADENLPTFEQLYIEAFGQSPSGPDWEAYRAIAALQALDIPLVVHPDMPADMLEGLRRAWSEMTADASWAELSTQRLGAPKPTISGEDAQRIWGAASQIPEGVRAILLRTSQQG